MRHAIQKLSIFLAVFCMLFSAVPAQAAAPAISKKSVSLYVGKSTTLKVKNSKGKIKWKSSNHKVAAVNKSGKITAKKAGTATITATVNKKNYTCIVTVKRKTVKVSKVKLNKSKITVKAGSSCKLKASVSPSKASNKALVWKSSNTDVASVDNKGSVSCKKAGTATITAVSSDGSKKKASCKVTVKDIRISRLAISSMRNVPAGGTLQLNASVQPAGLSKNFTWTSGNPGIATVSGNGLVKGVSSGTVKITATTKDKWKDSVSAYITVTEEQKSSEPATVPQKTTSRIEAACSLAEAASVNDVNSSNLTVYEIFSDGTRQELKNYSVKGEYAANDNCFHYTVTKTGTSISTMFTIKKRENSKVFEKITAECGLEEISSINEVNSSNVTVTGYYSDGSSSVLKAFKVDGVYNGSRNEYLFTVTTTGGKLSATFSVKRKETESAVLKDIEASCNLVEAESGYQFKTSDFNVNGIYSDGSKKSIGFRVDIAYSDGYYKATITAEGFTKTFSIPVKKTVSEPAVTGLSYSLNPSFVYAGENLAPGQLKVTANYSDGSQKDVSDYTTTFTPQSAAGEYAFDVVWKDIKKSLRITVREKETPKPSLTGLDAKFNRSFIYSDETPSASDITLTGTYSDGSTKQLTDFTYDFTPASGHMQNATLNVHYAENTLTLQVTSIVKAEPKSVEFKFTNESIKIGENIDRSNIQLTVTDYAGNTSSPTDFAIDFTPKSEAGTYPFTISYKGFSETFNVNVVE